MVELHRDRFAQAAGEWTDMTFGQRIPYENMATADKERHQKDLDIATRNLNAALLGSVEKHGARSHPRFFCLGDKVSICCGGVFSTVVRVFPLFVDAATV